jgi:hypothetical protein
VSAEGFSDPLGLHYAAGRKIYFLRAVSRRKVSYPLSHIDVSMAQQNNLAALLQRRPDLSLVGNGPSCRRRRQNT